MPDILYIRVAPLDEFRIGHETNNVLDYSEHFSTNNLRPPRLPYFETASESLAPIYTKCHVFLFTFVSLAGQVTLIPLSPYYSAASAAVRTSCSNGTIPDWL